MENRSKDGAIKIRNEVFGKDKREKDKNKKRKKISVNVSVEVSRNSVLHEARPVKDKSERKEQLSKQGEIPIGSEIRNKIKEKSHADKRIMRKAKEFQKKIEIKKETIFPNKRHSPISVIMQVERKFDEE